MLSNKIDEGSRIVLRLALGASFLSAVADRFGLWGPPGAAHVAWGDFAHFVTYTGKLNWFLPHALVPAIAWAATIAETLLGIALISARFPHIISLLSGLLLAAFALAMAASSSIKAPLDYSVFTASAAAFTLASLFRAPARTKGEIR